MNVIQRIQQVSFARFENFAHGEINERSFSTLPPTQLTESIYMVLQILK